jgi:hypothetical protein
VDVCNRDIGSLESASRDHVVVVGQRDCRATVFPVAQTANERYRCRIVMQQLLLCDACTTRTLMVLLKLCTRYNVIRKFYRTGLFVSRLDFFLIIVVIVFLFVHFNCSFFKFIFNIYKEKKKTVILRLRTRFKSKSNAPVNLLKKLETKKIYEVKNCNHCNTFKSWHYSHK